MPQLLCRYAEASMPTVHGRLTTIVYREAEWASRAEAPPDKEHIALLPGAPLLGAGKLPVAEGVLCRVHSECWTGESVGSLRCDCRDQLDRALAAMVAAQNGVLVYLRQEGRGIGLGNKIRAYALQDQGADTVEANEQLGFGADLRSYELAAAILADLGVASVRLMTNNPDKVAGLEAAGVRVVERMPHWGSDNEFNRDYLKVKQTKLGHER